MFSRYAELRPINGWDLSVGEFGAPQQISTDFASWLRYCSDVCSTDVNQTLHAVWQSPALACDIYIFGGSCPLTEFSQLQNSLCVQVFRSISAALLHGTRAVGVSQSLRRGTRNGITELSQTAPPVFGRAAITLGIDPHPSSIRPTFC